MSRSISQERAERLVNMLKLFVEHPGRRFNIRSFQEKFQLAKSTLSEDIVFLDRALKNDGTGRLKSQSGATGGVSFVPSISRQEKSSIVQELLSDLKKPERIMQGGFLYTSDIVFDPQRAEELGRLFYDRFRNTDIDLVATIETKGIPMALMAAKYLHVPLITIRKESRVTEGPSVSINYISGSTGQICTMSLPKNALLPGKKVLFIDDFMKGGGTASGVQMLIEQFGSELVGVGVMMVTAEPAEKLRDDYFAILTLHDIDVKNRLTRLSANSALG